MKLAWSPSGKPLSPSNQPPLQHSLTHTGLAFFSLSAKQGGPPQVHCGLIVTVTYTHTFLITGMKAADT